MGDKPPVIVVFDVNVYVDVAEVITQPFDWGRLEAAAAPHWNDPARHPSAPNIDSLRALLMSKTGRVGVGASSERLEVWSSAHIDDLVVKKVHEKIFDASGRAWTLANAQDFLDKLVYGLVFDMTRGGHLGEIKAPLNFPPLDYEDGCVMRTAKEAGEDPESPRYCVTRDRDFREACRARQLEPTVQVLYPHEWIIALRKARRPAMPRLRLE